MAGIYHYPSRHFGFHRRQLTLTGAREGVLMHDTPEVLFVCVHNARRSQMAATLLEHYAAGRVRVRSAGSTPASEVTRRGRSDAGGRHRPLDRGAQAAYRRGRPRG